MKKSQQVGISRNQENVKRVMKCPCPGNQNYIRKVDRPALSSIQSEAPQKQYLSANYEQKKTSLCRSLSLSGCSQNVSSNKPSFKLRESLSPCTESTKIISPIPPHITSTLQLPINITVRSRQILNSQPRAQPLAAPKPKFNSCGSGARSSIPDVLKPGSSQSIDVCRARKAVYKCEKGDGLLHPDSGMKPIAIKTICQPRKSLNNTERPLTSENNKSIHESKVLARLPQVQSYKGQCNKQTNKARSTEKLTPSIFSTQTPKGDSCSSASSEYTLTLHSRVKTERRPEKNATLANQQFVTLSHDTLTSTIGSNNFTTMTSTLQPENSTNGFTTLQNQHFVTLSQDTLRTTRSLISPELDSVISKMSNIRLIRDTSFLNEEERSFIDGQKFFQELDRGKCSTTKTIPICSPHSVSVPLRRSNIICNTSDGDSVRKPAVKSTLRRRSSIKKQIFFPLLYSPEYSEDLLSYCYKYKSSYVLKSEWVEIYVDKRARTRILDWLLQISGFTVPQFEPIYYMAVRLFDYSVIRLKLRQSHYQLAAVVAFWISLKYLDGTVLIKVPKIFSLCNGKYSKEQILSMERRILKSINFCLNMADPLDFLHHYLKSSNLENDELLKYGAKFILECATLFETYALIDAPFIAANAVYMAYQILRKTEEVYVNFIWFNRINIQHFVKNVLSVNVKYTIMEKYEPFNKYMTAERLYVAKAFLNI